MNKMLELGRTLDIAPGLEPSAAQKELMAGTAPAPYPPTSVSKHAQRAPSMRGHSSQAAGEQISGIWVRSLAWR